jgi:hypothetical protein
MLSPPTLGGAYLFGTCCHVVQQPDELVRQEDAFFAVPGVLSLNGAARGRYWTIEGVFVAPDLGTLVSYKQALTPGVPGSYVDGNLRDFTDSDGSLWNNVLLTGDFTTDPKGPQYAAGGGFTLGFRCTLRGLS